MSSNKTMKNKLIKLYGSKCFITILGFRKHDKEIHYKSKRKIKSMKKLTYHHIIEQSRGGKTTIENGALLSVENHIWFHQQSKENQELMNRAFQEYKKHFKECSVTLTNNLPSSSINIQPLELYITESSIEISKLEPIQEKSIIDE